jgi:hypothetical protein
VTGTFTLFFQQVWMGSWKNNNSNNYQKMKTLSKEYVTVGLNWRVWT